jgi:hypothetical protein
MAKEPGDNAATEEKPKKVRQGRLKGMEPKRIEAVDTAAERYYEVMMKRTKLSKQEHEAKDALIDEMLKAKLTKYETPDGLIVTALNKSNVEVKKKKEPTAEDNGKE